MLKLFQSTLGKLFFLLFVTLTIWWLAVTIWAPHNNNAHLAFAGVYGVMALLGGILGLRVSKKWGGLGSLLGRAILLISVGLLAQEFGQLYYAYLTDIKHIEIPYPSVG